MSPTMRDLGVTEAHMTAAVRTAMKVSVLAAFDDQQPCEHVRGGPCRDCLAGQVADRLSSEIVRDFLNGALQNLIVAPEHATLADGTVLRDRTARDLGIAAEQIVRVQGEIERALDECGAGQEVSADALYCIALAAIEIAGRAVRADRDRIRSELVKLRSRSDVVPEFALDVAIVAVDAKESQR